MSENLPRAERLVKQFRNISEVDKALVNRLVADRTERGNRDLQHVDLQPIASVFRRTAREASDIRNIFQTMPDLHLPREILVSAIVSPGDLSRSTLIFGNNLTDVDKTLTSALDSTLETFFVKEQHLESKVPEWIDDALVWSGAHPIMIIPESSLDRMILGNESGASLEAVASYDGEWAGDWFEPKGILGLRLPTAESSDYVSLEATHNRINRGKLREYHTIKTTHNRKSIELPFFVTDNMAVFRKPVVQEVKRQRTIERVYGTPSLEARKRQRRAERAIQSGEKLSNGQVYSKFFRASQATKRSRLEVVPTSKQTARDNLGHPLVYHLPIESVMPVCVPGDEKNHIGYIVILDNNGYPVSYSKRLSFYDDIRHMGTNNGSPSQSSGDLLNMAAVAINGNVANASNTEIDRLVSLHSDIIVNDLLARLKSGVLGGDFEISRSDHVDRLMLSRTFKNQLTTLLYVPAELMVYMAYDYNEFGVGKSLLEDAKALAAMRAAVTVANVIGATKNAIPGKDINIELDPDDKDPVGAATFMANEAMGLAYHHFPMGITSTVGLAEQLQMSSFSINVTGNPRYPEVKTTITPRESQKVDIDTDLQDRLRADLIRVFSLTPELVDNINQPEFATSIVQNNLLLLKRVMVLQGKTNPQITDYVRIFTYNSGILIEQLLDVIEQNTKFLPSDYKDAPEDFLEEYLNAVSVKLPEPDTDNLVNEIKAYENFSEALDKILPAFIREEYFDGYSPDALREAIPTVVEGWKGIILRNWMRKRGIFKELDVFRNAEDGTPMMDMIEEMTSHVDGVMKAIGPYVSKVARDTLSRKARLAKTVEDVKRIQDLIAGLDAPEEEEQVPEEDGQTTGDEGGDEEADDFDFGNETETEEEGGDNEETQEQEEEPAAEEPPVEDEEEVEPPKDEEETPDEGEVPDDNETPEDDKPKA